MKTKTRIKKKQAIELILSLMNQCKRHAPTILGKIEKNWEITSSSFYRYFKEAEKIHTERQQRIENAKLEATIESETEALRKRLNDKNRHAEDILKQIERLETITAGKALKVEGQLIIATFADESRAKAEIRAMKKLLGEWYGFNAPKQLDMTTAGQPLTSIDLSLLDTDTLQKILAAQKCKT